MAFSLLCHFNCVHRDGCYSHGQALALIGVTPICFFVMFWQKSECTKRVKVLKDSPCMLLELSTVVKSSVTVAVPISWSEKGVLVEVEVKVCEKATEKECISMWFHASYLYFHTKWPLDCTDFDLLVEGRFWGEGSCHHDPRHFRNFHLMQFPCLLKTGVFFNPFAMVFCLFYLFPARQIHEI